MNFEMKKRALFLDRDGVLVNKDNKNSFEKLYFMSGVFNGLKSICDNTDYSLVMVSNQDGVNTPALPLDRFTSVQNRIVETFQGEGVSFDDILVDYSLKEDNCPGRKPGIGMMGEYQTSEWDLSKSVMVGDRLTDMEFAKNLGCKGIWFSNEKSIPEGYEDTIILASSSWQDISTFLTDNKVKAHRKASIQRTTKETSFNLSIDLDGSGKGELKTNIGFFDHMIEQIIKHSHIDLNGTFSGDLEVDEHHSVEDLAITLGSLIKKALGDKRGINRYGSDMLIMDDVVARVAIDFSARAEFIYDVDFKREYIGTFPTEMIKHFFKSFSNAAECNLYLNVSEGNSHHMAEALFKAFARSIKVAVKRDPSSNALPSTKGVL
ncbi:imidazoleglycerol-phosphate dehydratase HisB [Bullifex sp.]|uniref:imidazoleglycerol-phosphate dehydratase HisB n=1 Tax=Bullifex sp. TaxID=2815808 RepID=UPI002A838F41|nr:imidazoleglycerol-phosphate dehydratase HisB [Bullifex sp.]MDY4068048.1 imidazoleglycerol-phosphate dehydratase HisB [Bullifex sp.]